MKGLTLTHLSQKSGSDGIRTTFAIQGAATVIAKRTMNILGVRRNDGCLIGKLGLSRDEYAWRQDSIPWYYEAQIPGLELGFFRSL